MNPSKPPEDRVAHWWFVTHHKQNCNLIAEIVKSLKSYSYLDQAPTQSIDIHDGLNDTIVMLGSKLKRGVEVRRDYAPDVPTI